MLRSSFVHRSHTFRPCEPILTDVTYKCKCRQGTSDHKLDIFQSTARASFTTGQKGINCIMAMTNFVKEVMCDYLPSNIQVVS